MPPPPPVSSRGSSYSDLYAAQQAAQHSNGPHQVLHIKKAQNGTKNKIEHTQRKRNDEIPSNSPNETLNSHSSLSSSSASIPPSAPHPHRANTWIAGFPGMDTGRPKTAGGSGGEKTLRHRLFPFHDIPSDNDPHRAMHRSVSVKAIEEARMRNFHGINVLNEAYTDPQPTYSKPPPPRTTSEFGRLIAPELFPEHIKADLPSELSTKHRPAHQRNAVDEHGLSASELATAQLKSSDPHRAFYEQMYDPVGSPTRKYRPRPTSAYDSSRAGFHSRDAALSSRKQGPAPVPAHLYTTASVGVPAGVGSVAGGFSALGPTGGVMVPSAAESADIRARVDGRTPPRLDRSRDGESGGIRYLGGSERRPGSKPIREENLKLRRSDAVAEILQADARMEKEIAQRSEASRTNKPHGSLHLNHPGRQRDFGQNESYDIITLAGAGGETGRDPIPTPTASSSRASLDAAGRSSRDAHARDHAGLAWSGVGGSGFARQHAAGGRKAADTRGSQHPNQISSLDNTFMQAETHTHTRPHTAAEPTYRGNHRAITRDRNSSNDVWALITGR